MSQAIPQIDPRTTTASSDPRERISAAVQRVDRIQISSDVGRLLVHWLGQHAEWAKRRNGCAPEGLEDVQYALAEAVARGIDSHAARLDVTLPQLVSDLVTVRAAADVLGIKETTVRYHYKNGSLSGTKTGTALMIDTKSLAAFRANREGKI